MFLLILTISTIVIFLYGKSVLQKIKLAIWAAKIPGPVSLPILGCTHRFICRREGRVDLYR